MRQRQLVVRKRLRLFATRYDVLGRPSRDQLAYVDAAHGGPSTVYRDESRADTLFALRTRAHHLPAQCTDVEDPDGRIVGTLRAVTGTGRRVWHLESDDRPTVTGRERSVLGAFLRGVQFGWLPAHFDFTVDGRPAFTVHRRFGLARYVVEIADDGLDRRLVVAQVVALDAF
jgi:hypothetical protein